jgi:hypothetical protein
VSSDGGALLLREVEGRIHLLEQLAGCFSDDRSPLLITHQLSKMLSQRIYGWRWAMRIFAIMSSCCAGIR